MRNVAYCARWLFEALLVCCTRPPTRVPYKLKQAERSSFGTELALEARSSKPFRKGFSFIGWNHEVELTCLVWLGGDTFTFEAVV